MTEVETYVCINCPIGCPLQLVHEGQAIEEISGHECNRGAKYAKQEFVDPRRTFSTTIPIEGAAYARLPVQAFASATSDSASERNCGHLPVSFHVAFSPGVPGSQASRSTRARVAGSGWSR